MTPRGPWSYTDRSSNRRALHALARLVVDAAPEMDDRPRLAYWALARWNAGEATRDELREAWLDLSSWCADSPDDVAARAVLRALHAAVVQDPGAEVALAVRAEDHAVDALVATGEPEVSARARVIEVVRAAMGT